MEFINWWAVIASMIVSIVLGFIWYGPLFGKMWMKLSGINMPGKPSTGMMVKPIILSLIGAFFMTWVLSMSIGLYNAYYATAGFGAAFTMAFMLWLGFHVPAYLNFTGWEGKSWKLFFINAGYWLVFLLISAAIIVSLV